MNPLAIHWYDGYLEVGNQDGIKYDSQDFSRLAWRRDGNDDVAIFFQTERLTEAVMRALKISSWTFFEVLGSDP